LSLVHASLLVDSALRTVEWRRTLPGMSSLVNVAIHSSQLPEGVWADLRASLRSAQINHKFLYDSVKLTQKWLALHQAYAPARTDPNCVEVYERGFAAAASQFSNRRVSLVSLGCGGGRKDLRALQLLQHHTEEVSYLPMDVSLAMVMAARQTVLGSMPGLKCFPLVCDLGKAEDLPAILDDLLKSADEAWPTPKSGTSGGRAGVPSSRFITFFGMLPNFEPQVVLPRLAGLVRPGDLLLLSANLAPGPDYAAGVERILPLYDNPLTRDWLMAFLLDLGLEKGDGNLRFVIEEVPPIGLKRVAACYQFARDREVVLETERFQFLRGQSLRVFFSFRHTPRLVQSLLEDHGLQIIDQWITPSEEEGVFLAKLRHI
jgi:L-histidine Nalpha-methyltransferase